MNISQLRAGVAALNEAGWIGDFPALLFPMFGDIRLKVRRAYTAEWHALRAQLLAEITDLSAEANEARIERECLARTVLVDWQGIDEAYAPELAISILADAESGPVFRGVLFYAISQREAQVRASIEDAAKN